MKNLNVLLVVALLGLGVVACKESTPEDKNTVVKEEVKEEVNGTPDTTKKAEEARPDSGITVKK